MADNRAEIRAEMRDATPDTVAADQVSPWVRRWSGLIPDGEVLDLACGNGRHARHLAASGRRVLALDRDSAALARAGGPGIETVCFDLEADGAAWPFARHRFAAIVVTNYLHRPLMAALVDSLASDGVLLYETFAAGNAEFGKPSNPAFLLEPGELLAWAARCSLRVVAFEDGRGAAPKAAMVQRLCAVRPDFPRSAALLPAF